MSYRTICAMKQDTFINKKKERKAKERRFKRVEARCTGKRS